MNRSGTRRWVALALAGPWLAGVALLAAANLGYAGMWWDEAAQFWVSQGLSGYSPPFTRPAGLREVARANCLENLDPGGFTGLLHLWTAGGRGLPWLRALPFAFFVAGSLALGALGWRLTRSVPLAITAGAAASLYPATLYFALEIRAYSMEMAGVAIGVLALDRVQARPSAGRAFLVGLVAAVFLTSRYSYLFVALALAGALLRACTRNAAPRAASQRLLAFLLPVGVIALPIWWVTLSRQLPVLRGGPFGLASPPYTRTAVLLHGAHDLQLIGRNLFSPPALPITVAVLFAALLRRRLYDRLTRLSPDPELERARARYGMHYAFIAATQAASALASALGLYPWDISTRWSAYLVTLSAVAAVVLAAEGRSLALAALARRRDAEPRARYVRLLGGGAAALVVLVAAAGAAQHRQSIESVHRTSVAAQIDQLPVESLDDRAVFVAFYEVPMLRYLYEYGPYRGRPEYPRRFRFETPAEWRARSVFSARAEGVSYLVSGLSPVEAEARFADATARPFGTAGSRLLRLVPRPGSP